MKNLELAIDALSEHVSPIEKVRVMVAMADTHLNGRFGYDPSAASRTIAEHFNTGRHDADDIVDFLTPYIIN